MKPAARTFFRSWYLSAVILLCLIFGCYGMTKAYENTRLIRFGEYRHAVEYEDGTLYFFDFTIPLRGVSPSQSG